MSRNNCYLLRVDVKLRGTFLPIRRDLQRINLRPLSFLTANLTESGLLTAEVKSDEYVVLGLACCFQRDTNGKPQEVIIIEPLPTSTLETVLQGVPTSYKRLLATTYGQAKELSSIPKDFIGEDRVSLCENYEERLQAASRTYRVHPEAKKFDVGTKYYETNFSTTPKRILNEKFEPSFEDNVKQDISIDVYGRNKDEKDVQKQIEDLYNT
eukprot:jgi/Galph1/655/GphlegSOOS_G5336.1